MEQHGRTITLWGMREARHRRIHILSHFYEVTGLVQVIFGNRIQAVWTQ